MQHRVFLAAHVQVHGHPVPVRLLTPSPLRVQVVGVPEVVPAAAGPLGHGVRLAREPAALGVLEVPPVLGARQAARGVVPRLEVVHLRQRQRQLVLGHGDGGVEVDGVRGAGAGVAPGVLQRHGEVDGDGLAPVPLPAEHPVAQLVGHLRAPCAQRLQPGDHGGLAGLGGEPVELARVHGHAGGREGRLVHGRPALALARRRGHHLLDGEAEGPGEGEVPLVVGGHGHDRARPVGPQHVVGHPDGHLLPRERVHGRGARGHARLLGLGAHRRPVHVALARRGLHVGPHGLLLALGGDLFHQRVLGGQHHVGHAQQGVRPRGVHGEGVLRARHPEVDPRPDGAADPGLLRGPGALGPLQARLLQPGLQLVGVLGDLEHPLAQRQPLDRVRPALREPVDHLLVGQHRAQRRAPVHQHLALRGQALLEELEEDPLGPLDVVEVGGGHLPVPVEGEAQALELALEVGDVLGGGLPGVRAGVDGVLLGGQPEAVPAHGVQHVQVLHAVVPGHDVRGGVALGVAHVQAGARGVWEHVQDVLLPLALAAHGLEGLVGLPVVLPFLLHLQVVELIGHRRWCRLG
mmetsp:Transcript_1213/g.2220  ORF Transcript_1213/g.2220 Transcript_1213/m.2220 type:complete len:576 (+) Transcript_1213:1033-2760(+)